MKLYNIHQNKVETLSYIDNNGIKYPSKMSDAQLNAIGYYRLEYNSQPNRKYYTFTESKKVKDGKYVISYTKVDRPLDSIKSAMINNLKKAFEAVATRPKVDTGLGYFVDGGRNDLENFNIGRKHSLPVITDADNNTHAVSDSDYDTIINAIELKGMELMSMKWARRDEINALADVESCEEYEKVPFAWDKEIITPL